MSKGVVSIRGLIQPLERGSCSYFSEREAATEILIVDSVSESEFVSLLNMGFRHFGRIFFRPHCPQCRRCIPIRVDLRRFRCGRSLRRVLSKAAGYTVSYGRPYPDRRIYELYTAHKEKFGTDRRESYATFFDSFRGRFPFSYQLSIFDHDRLIAVSYFDAVSPPPAGSLSCNPYPGDRGGTGILSAVYCFYDLSYEQASLGTLAILKEIEYARRHRIRYIYLGYCIEENRHMRYKSRFYPNQLLERENTWVEYIGRERVPTEEGRDAAEKGFLPENRISPAR